MRPAEPLALLLVALALVPALASAAPAPAQAADAPGSYEFFLREPPLLEGRVDMRGTGWFFADLTAAVTAGALVELVAAGGEMASVGWTEARLGVDRGVHARAWEEPRREPFERVRISGFRCLDACGVWLFAEPGGTRADAASLVVRADRHVLAWLTEHRWVVATREGVGGHFHLAKGDRALFVPPGSLLLGSERASTVEAEGRLRLLVWNATFEVRDAHGRVERASATEHAQEVDARAGSAGASRGNFLELDLRGARMAAFDAPELWAAASRVDVALEGSVAGSGSVRASGGEASAPGAFLLRGVLQLAAEPSEYVRPDDPVGRRTGLLLRDPPVRLSASGDIAEARLGGVRTTSEPASAERAPWLAPAALALLWLVLHVLVAGFSRFTRQDLLDHPVRRRLYETLSARPGLAAGALAKETRLHRGVVRYHLATLVRHGLLVARRDGRAATYAPVGARQAPRDAHAEVGTRGSILEALARLPEGATQAELARRTGLSQRLVSYHLRKLVDAGRVRVEGRYRARYALREDDAAG